MLNLPSNIISPTVMRPASATKSKPSSLRTSSSKSASSADDNSHSSAKRRSLLAALKSFLPRASLSKSRRRRSKEDAVITQDIYSTFLSRKPQVEATLNRHSTQSRTSIEELYFTEQHKTQVVLIVNGAEWRFEAGAGRNKRESTESTRGAETEQESA